MFWWDAKEQRKRGNGKRKQYNVLERLNSLGLQTNSSTPFLKEAFMEKKANESYLAHY